jgi:hypothetical protein
MGKTNKRITSISNEDLKRTPYLLKLKIAIWLFWIVYMPKLPLPLLIHFAILASLCMFILLPVMPHHPLAIPIVIGGGLAGGLLLSGGHYVPESSQ